jgi:hypothetical protein
MNERINLLIGFDLEKFSVQLPDPQQVEIYVLNALRQQVLNWFDGFEPCSIGQREYLAQTDQADPVKVVELYWPSRNQDANCVEETIQQFGSRLPLSRKTKAAPQVLIYLNEQPISIAVTYQICRFTNAEGGISHMPPSLVLFSWHELQVHFPKEFYRSTEEGEA